MFDSTTSSTKEEESNEIGCFMSQYQDARLKKSAIDHLRLETAGKEYVALNTVLVLKYILLRMRVEV